MSMSSSKKGLVYANDATVPTKLASVNAGWHYNWGYSIQESVNVPFVPMIWGLKTVPQTAGLAAEVPGFDHVLLGFNEPDGAKQSNVSVADAIAHWSSLMATGRRLGSPATAGNPTAANSWLSQFMAEAKAQNLRVDFICVHWYAPPHAKSFLAEIDAIYAQYGLPIWITEFSPADWSASATTPAKFTSQDAIDFMNQIVPELNSRPFVERFTWKTRSTEDVNLGFAALFNDDGSLTAVGEAYAKL